MTGPLWEHSGVSGWKFKGVLGASVHLNVKEALGGLGRTPLPGSSGERADCWEACGKGLKTSTFLQTALVSIKWRFLTKTWFFFSEDPPPVAPGIPELCPELCRRRRRFWLGAHHCGIRALMFMSGNQSLYFESRKMILGHIVGVCRGLMFTGCFGNAVASSL